MRALVPLQQFAVRRLIFYTGGSAEDGDFAKAAWVVVVLAQHHDDTYALASAVAGVLVPAAR
eukprot:2340620-Lingulodinium_polyedra.AAC.1